jgi:hypothetical protein
MRHLCVVKFMNASFFSSQISLWRKDSVSSFSVLEKNHPKVFTESPSYKVCSSVCSVGKIISDCEAWQEILSSIKHHHKTLHFFMF